VSERARSFVASASFHQLHFQITLQIAAEINQRINDWYLTIVFFAVMTRKICELSQFANELREMF